MQESDIFLLAQNNDLDELQKVLSSGDHDLVHSKNSHNFTLLHIAAKYNHFEVVEFLISQTNDINCKNVAGDTPLILAAMVGSKSIIKLLVDYGADVNMTNDHGNSPLHYSCFYNHEACTIFLVGECNALVNVLNRYGKSPLSHSNTNLQEKLQLLVDQSQTDTIVAKARSFADAEIENKLNFLTKVGLNFEIPPTSIQMEKNFKKTYRSDVKKGVWHGRYVVIKKLQKQVASTLEIKILKEEISQIRILSHKNLELIIAACLTLPHLSILTEFEANGNLFDLLRSPSWELGPSTAILIAIGICDGMIYLEEQRAHHYNLKSKNVLITADNIPKLADYGFKDSIFASYPKLTAADQSVYASQIQLDKQTGKIEVKYPPSLLYDVPWVAPEILLAMSADSNLEVDFSCADVYSYGVVFFEIVTRSEPYEEMNNMRIGYLVSNLNVRPEVPDFVPDNLASLLFDCWSDNPKDRIDFRTIGTVLEEFLDESDPQSTKKEAEVKIKPTAAVTAPSSVVILQGKAPVLLKPGMASKLQSASQRKAAEQKIEASSEIESRKNTTNEISVSYVQGSNSQNSVVDSRGSGEISSISARKQRPISSFIGFSSNSVKTNSAPISIIHSAHSPIFGQANRDSSENLALYKTEDEESNLTEVSLKEKLANRATFDFDNIPLSLKNRPKQNTSVREIFESLQLEIGNQDDEEDEFISREIIDNEDEDEDESILGSTFVSRKPTVQPVKTNFSRVVTMVSQKPTYKQQVMEAEQIKSPKMDNYKTISTYVHAFDPSIYEQERFSRDYDDDDEIAVAKPMESFSTQDLVSAMPGSAVRSTPISALKVEMGPSKAINMAANLPVRKEIVITDVSPNKQVSMGKTVSEAFITNKKTGTSPSVSLSVSLQNDRVIKPVVANLPAISGGMMAQPVSNNDFIKAKITMPGVKDDKIFEKKLDVSDLDDLDGLLGEMNEF